MQDWERDHWKDIVSEALEEEGVKADENQIKAIAETIGFCATVLNEQTYQPRESSLPKDDPTEKLEQKIAELETKLEFIAGKVTGARRGRVFDEHIDHTLSRFGWDKRGVQ